MVTKTALVRMEKAAFIPRKILAVGEFDIGRPFEYGV